MYQVPGTPGDNLDNSGIQIEFDLGPIDDGAEVVTKFWTDLDTTLSPTRFRLFTDDNGLEIQVRAASIAAVTFLPLPLLTPSTCPCSLTKLSLIHLPESHCGSHQG